MKILHSEIFLGLVAPVGVDLSHVQSLLEDYLSRYKYEAKIIRFSNLMLNMGKLKTQISSATEYKRVDTSMTAGNELREKTKQADILARLAMVEIQAIRKSKEPKLSNAYIFRSIKHPEEVVLLRFVYGKGFFLLGFSSSRKNRLEYLEKRKGMTHSEAEKLINRDEEEINKFGQHTRDAFHISDVFFDVDNAEFEKDLKRYLDLIFGNPYLTPTKDEFAMFLAFAASFRSGDLARQVGAVIASEEGEIIATGCNDVPKKGGGLYWTDDPTDKRDYKLGFDSNKAKQNEIAENILAEFGLENTKENKDRLKGTGLFDITEYGRAVHAEMEALLACGRTGVRPRGGTLYSTTFPCHNCAKHIVASGIIRVVFIEPYPKSKALDLHDDSIIFDTKNKKNQSKVVFQPFIGVGPRRFIDLFSIQMSSGVKILRKRGGKKIVWKEGSAVFRFQLLGMSYLDKEISIGAELKRGEKNHD